MTAIQIVLPNEVDALSEPEIHALDRQVFNALALATEWETGVIGSVHRISYGRIAGYLTEDIPRKAKGALQVVTRKQVANSVARLVRAGLLKYLPTSERECKLERVFWRELVAADQSVKNPDGQQMGKQMARLSQLFSNNNNNLENNQKSSGAIESVSDGQYRYIHTYNNAREEKPDEFAMPDDWQPDDKALEYLRALHGNPPKQIKPEWTAEFVLYWRVSRGEVRLTRDQWRMRWAKQVMRYLRNPGYFERVNGLDVPEQTAPTLRVVGGKQSRPDRYQGRRTESNDNPHKLKRLPPDDEGLVVYARGNGLFPPGEGESWGHYRARLEQARELFNTGKEFSHVARYRKPIEEVS